MADSFELGAYGETVGATAAAIEELQGKLADAEERWRSVDALLTKSGDHCRKQLESQRARHDAIAAQQAERIATLEAEHAELLAALSWACLDDEFWQVLAAVIGEHDGTGPSIAAALIAAHKGDWLESQAQKADPERH